LGEDRKFSIGFGLIAFAILLAFQYWLAFRSVAFIDFSQFLTYPNAGKIAAFTVTETEITGTFTEPLDGRSEFTTTRVEPGIALELAGHNVQFGGGHDQT